MTLDAVQVSPRTTRTRHPELVIAPGPAHLAQPGAGTFAELYGCPWALALHATGPALYQLTGGTWTARSDAAALGPLVPGVRHVGLAFDQAARPVVTWESGGAVYVRQWSPGAAQYVTRGPWAGRDPVVTCDALAHGLVTQSDVTLWYVAGGGLVQRVQADSYAVPYLLAVLPAGAVLDQIIPAGYCLELAGEAGGAPLYLRSDLFPVGATGAAQAAVSGLGGGAIRNAVQLLTVPQDLAQVAVSGLSGAQLITTALLVVAVPQDLAQVAVSGLGAGARLVDAVQLLTVPQDLAQVAVSGLGAGARLATAVIAFSVPRDTAQGTVTGLGAGGSLVNG